MTEVKIAGVDFSGARDAANETWLAIGVLGGLGLEIQTVKKTGAVKLAAELSANLPIAVCGMDFPFSLPVEFLAFLSEKLDKPSYQSWQDVAETLVFTGFDQFIELVKEFGKEPKRFADSACERAAQSPLHRGNPSMVQMTYHGIRMLAALDPAKFYVPPLQEPRAGACEVIEVYPRASLALLGLPDTGYKGKSDRAAKEQSLALRKQMLSDLLNLRERKGHADCPRISVAKGLEPAIVESDHALDAVIACYTAATKQFAPKLFADPLEQDNLDVLLEGWIYTPKGLAKK